jgi:hypothetical protein
VAGVQRVRPAWEGSTRRERLPANWPQLREQADADNPEHICHWCGRPGGSDLDHVRRGDDVCQHPDRHSPGCICNLGWIHNRQDYLEGRSAKNCHGQKTGAEGAAARQPLNRPDDVHPALR